VGSRPLGQLIVVLGLILIVIGLLTMRGWLGWFGHLPGDVRVERENARIYVPIVSMLLISILFSVLSYVLRRIF
jgi:membrane protein implicated in regulation of membrane protease activity